MMTNKRSFFRSFSYENVRVIETPSEPASHNANDAKISDLPYPNKIVAFCIEQELFGGGSQQKPSKVIRSSR